jgi:hypothetical protein
MDLGIPIKHLFQQWLSIIRPIHHKQGGFLGVHISGPLFLWFNNLQRLHLEVLLLLVDLLLWRQWFSLKSATTGDSMVKDTAVETIVAFCLKGMKPLFGAILLLWLWFCCPGRFIGVAAFFFLAMVPLLLLLRFDWSKA